ncbi:MAG: AAA family ATPase, partial [Verrucomicrobiota bacterium]
HEEQVEALEMKLMHHEGNLEVDRERLQHTRLVHSTLDGKQNLLGREIQTLETKIESLEWEQAEVEKRAEASDANMSGLHEQQDAAALNLEQTRARINQLTDELKNTEKLAHESAAQVNDLRTALAVEQRTHENLREQREPMTSRMRELNDIIERRRKEIEAYHDRIASSAEENERLGKESEAAREVTTELEQQMQQLGEQRSDRAAAIETAEAELIELRRTLSANQEQRGNEEIKTTQLDLRIENVRTTILQRYQIHLENFEPDPHALLAAIETQKKARSSAEKRRATRAAKEAAQEDGTDDQDHPETEDPLPEAESETESPAQEPETEPAPVATDGEPDWTFVESVVNELKQKLDSMGPVNIEAIEEFEELEERHTFLDGQHKDLVEGREELLRVISKINRETRKKFAETFATIRTNFQDMFSELFGKGAKADLVLMDESDPLECGIEIIAKPPGKKLQSISLLSGGERSMTAVALLFAIYMVKPSPFCVLDELDAPLDEANIERFLRVLDRFIGQSQFVIVTHSKRTMSRADIMYGVTMEEYGVSKRIGMKLTGEDHKPNPTLASPEKSKA